MNIWYTYKYQKYIKLYMVVGGNFMAFSYNKLWKLLIDKKMNKTALRDAIGITPSTLARLSKNQNVTMDVLGKICKELDCNIEDIVEYVRDEDRA
jgi:putative transcriptional regulator